MIGDYDMPPLRVIPKMVDAETYNTVRLTLRRLGSPLRVALVDHRGLDMILCDDRWLCVDSLRADLPVLAWREFETRRRRALHLPIECRLYLYHVHAGLIMGTALERLAVSIQALRRSKASADAGITKAGGP